jgi:hypothetical protein
LAFFFDAAPFPGAALAFFSEAVSIPGAVLSFYSDAASIPGAALAFSSDTATSYPVMQFSCDLSFPGAAPPASYYIFYSAAPFYSIAYLFWCSSAPGALICGGPPLMRAIIGPQANTPERNILQVIRRSNFRPTGSKKYIFPDLNFTHFFLTLFSTFSLLSRSFLMFTSLILSFSHFPHFLNFLPIFFTPYIFIILLPILFYSIHVKLYNFFTSFQFLAPLPRFPTFFPPLSFHADITLLTSSK